MLTLAGCSFHIELNWAKIFWLNFGGGQFVTEGHTEYEHEKKFVWPFVSLINLCYMWLHQIFLHKAFSSTQLAWVTKATLDKQTKNPFFMLILLSFYLPAEKHNNNILLSGVWESKFPPSQIPHKFWSANKPQEKEFLPFLLTFGPEDLSAVLQQHTGFLNRNFHSR